jgi:hypothetical protein
LFSGQFDAAYFQGVHTIGLMHHKIGLEPRWYIGGYAYVLNRLVALAVRTHRWSPGKLVKLIEAVNAGVMLDMDIAISVYQDALVAEKERRGKRLDVLLRDFESKTAVLAGIVASAATELEATSRHGGDDGRDLGASQQRHGGGRGCERQRSDGSLSGRGIVGVDLRNLASGGAVVRDRRTRGARCQPY